MTKNHSSIDFYLSGNGYTRIPLITSTIGHRQVLARIGGVSGIFIVDTGASITLIDKDYAEQASINWTSPKKQVNIAGGGDQELLETEAIEMHIDQLTFYLSNLYISDLSHINQALTDKGTRNIVGVLGADILLSNSAIIDYDSGALYLKPQSDY